MNHHANYLGRRSLCLNVMDGNTQSTDRITVHGDFCTHVYVGDAPYVKLLWPLVIFEHAYLDSHTDSHSLRAEYCIVGIPHNTAI